MPAGILAIAVVIGIIYSMNPQNGTNQTDQPPAREGLWPGGRNQVGLPTYPPLTASTHPPMAASTHSRIAPSTDQRIAASAHPPVTASSHPRMATSTHSRIAASSHQPIIASTHPRIVPSSPVVPTSVSPTASSHQPNTASTHSPMTASPQKNSDQDEMASPLREGTFELSTRAAAVLASRNVEIAAQESRRHQGAAEATDTQAQPTKDKGDSVDFRTSQIIAAVDFTPPSAIGTEDEVRKFFKDYVERYNRMDLEGFLSLFSSGAIQNKKDGLEKIRKIYTNFFNQGQEVRYRVQDMRIEIYQNAVEVRARYEIDQVLKTGGKMGWRGNVHWVLGKENGILKILSLDYQHHQIY